MSAVDQANPIPSTPRSIAIAAQVGTSSDAGADAVGVLVSSDTDTSAAFGLDQESLRSAGFDAKPGQTFILPKSGGPVSVLIGIGTAEALDTTALRDAAAAFARAVGRLGRLALVMPDQSQVAAADAAQAMVEGAVLARYNFSLRSRPGDGVELAALTLLTTEADQADVQRGCERGSVFSAAAAMGRDLATCPASILTATRMGQLAVELGERAGLSVEIFDRQALIDLGCGGLLGVNLGSVEEPRMIKLSYPGKPGGAHLSLVGKGIMYDSGGISLKPSDAVHATMKNDMSGAAAILSAMLVLAELECETAVTGFLMCTDNMPSGSALKLGDVITMRGGTTVEVLNTDAEGRLVMADALVLATEEPTDAIVDIATLTGATMRALGTEIAGLFGSSQPLMEQIKRAAEASDEQVWQFPLAHRYRAQLNSDIADISNLGGANAGGITAALFLAEFVGDRPWAHIDIAGTSQSDTSTSWRTKGPTGFGTRLLIDLALDFKSPTESA